MQNYRQFVCNEIEYFENFVYMNLLEIYYDK